jgi:short subunit fatty acids transporter
MFLFENEDDLCFLWEFGFWILITQPSHSYTLAYCRSMHLISIEFQNIDNNPATPTKITFSSPSIVIILQSVQSLWLEFFLQTTGIYKILRLEVEKCNFIFIFILHASKYMFEV